MSTVNCYIKLDPAKCIDCGACQAACLSHHGKKENAVEGKARGLVVVNCQHCENAPCGNVCPVSAISQGETGIIIDNDKCVGCGLCQGACPFNAILMLERKHTEDENPRTKRLKEIAHKCDLCDGIEGNKCIEFCPTNALSLVSSSDEKQNKAIKIANMMGKKK